MSIRIATKNDLEQMDTVQRASFPASMHEDMALFASILDHPNSIGYLFYHDNKIVAYILGYPTHEKRQNFQTGPEKCENADMMYIHDLCVHPDFQDIGIGISLFERFQEETQKGNFKGIIAMAILGRLSYWERQGFKAIENSNYRGIESTRVEKYF